MNAGCGWFDDRRSKDADHGDFVGDVRLRIAGGELQADRIAVAEVASRVTSRARVNIGGPDGSGLKRIGEHGNFCGSPKWAADSRRAVASCMPGQQTMDYGAAGVPCVTAAASCCSAASVATLT